jgi:hypothetical protein
MGYNLMLPKDSKGKLPWSGSSRPEDSAGNRGMAAYYLGLQNNPKKIIPGYYRVFMAH